MESLRDGEEGERVLGILARGGDGGSSATARGRNRTPASAGSSSRVFSYLSFIFSNVLCYHFEALGTGYW